MKNKKLILGIVVSAIVLLVVCLGIYFMFFINKEKKINVYLFWGDGCPHCEHAKEYFSSIEDEYGKYYDLVEYEVWYDEDNKELMSKVSEELGEEGSGVPFIVIGDDYFRGYSSSMNERIESAIISQYENEDYIDIVEKVK